MARPIQIVGPVLHGVECYEAWRNFEDCPHEKIARERTDTETTLLVEEVRRGSNGER